MTLGRRIGLATFLLDRVALQQEGRQGMPDREISIPYKSPLIAGARLLVLITFPLWGVAAPVSLLSAIVGGVFALLLGFFELLRQPVYFFSALASTGGSCAFWATVAYLGIRGVLITGDRELTLNEQGISFPADFMFALKFKRQRQWQELGGIRVVYRNDAHRMCPHLLLTFKSGHQAKINLACLKSEEQVEQLLLGLQVWAPDADSQQEIASLLEHTGYRTSSGSLPTFTQMWEEQINRHYSSTAFIPLQKGARLQSGRIQIIEPIAFGGLSAVYLAQLNSAETVVVKELAVDDVSEGEILNKAHAMFKREAEILMKLSHRRIARVLDHFSENGRSYLVLEHVAGQNLRNLVRQSGLRTEKSVIDWGLQLTDILQYIHSLNPPVIHKDITPDNLVLSNGSQIVLIDFGAANEFLGTATGTLVGKQAYISPEQFKGKAVVQSDIYAFGATLFFLLTGEDPEPLSQSRPGRLKSGLSEALDDLIADCTNFDWQKRPASAAEVHDRLSALLNTGNSAGTEVSA
jgi:tRNA A-37 threonylcarbamoyl transferase component Bud32